jgi:nucleotide-binding universal stress UspA family protein
MKRFFVGADSSDGADSALRWAAQLATQRDAEVVVMTRIRAYGFRPAARAGQPCACR